MPTRDGKKSVQDAIDVGMPFVTASGLPAKVYHQDGCGGMRPCVCGVEGALRKLASDIDRVLEQYPAPSSKSGPGSERG